MKEFLYNEEETRQKLRDETGDSVLVVFSHDGFKIEYKERNKAERLLHDIKQANFNGNENLDITEYYEQVSSDPAYETVIEINEEEMDLMVEHKAYTGGDHVISPLEEDAIGPTINPNTDEYNHHIKFKGLIDGANEDMLYLRVKTNEKMDKLEDYLFIPSFEITESMVSSVIDSISNHEDLADNPACNACVRDAFYMITGSTIFYPSEGWQECVTCGGDYMDGGEIDSLGKANDIYNELTEGDGTLRPYFEEIEDMNGEDYPNFVNMQESVNNGQIIIGVYYNPNGDGHVVIMTPERFYVEQDGDKEFINIGEGELVLRPISLECGSPDKRIKPSQQSYLDEFKWYKYNP
jgi:hypothetical protein